MNDNHTQSLEQRQHIRIPFDASVSLLSGNFHSKGTLVDISLQGALTVLPRHTLKMDQCATLTIFLDQDTTHMLNLEVVVRHIANEQVGLLFERMTLDVATELRTLLHHNLANEQLLEREFEQLIISH